MFRGWFNRIALIAIWMSVMVSCNPSADVPAVASATPEPSPELVMTQLAELMRRGKPDDPVVCTADDAAEFEAVPGAQPGINWAVIFEYDFTPGWSFGQHDYTLWFEPCPYSGELPDHLTSSIMVTSSEPLRASPIYFGPLGVTITSNPHGSILEAINPLQAAIARVSDIRLTQDEAQTVARQCAIWISWAEGSRYALFPHKPCRYEVH